MELLIRPMIKEDWEAVASIFKEGIDMKTATFHTEVPTYEVWDQSHLKACRFVAIVDDVIAGWVALTPYSSRCVYSGVAEVSVYIKTEFRGKQVGKRLLEELVRSSEDNGIWTLQSGILENNIASIALHKSIGFRMVGYREKLGRDPNGEWQNTVIMERRSSIVGC